MKAHLIGEVIPAPHPHTGFLVRCYRYGSGRKLPAPRILLDASHPKLLRPFATRVAALDALNEFRTAPRSVHKLRPLDAVDNPVREHRPAEVSIRNAAFTEPPVRKRRRIKAEPRPRPEVVKMPPPPLAAMPERTSEQLLIDLFIASGALKVTHCEEHVRQDLRPKRHGGHLPAHLDPVTLS